MQPSHTHLVLIPSYNTGAKLLLRTVREARAVWSPVWVVVDGSTDDSPVALTALAARDPGLRVLHLARNSGKGAAVLEGLRQAEPLGFTHALVLDSDGQHPADRIAEFMTRSAAVPHRMVLGQPVFGPDAPVIRVLWRRLSNWLVKLETLQAGIGDSLFGFRVYPLRPLLEVMTETRWMRGFDFDAEAAVRLCWRGVDSVRVPVRVRYLGRDECGVSHFSYGRDNLILTFMHARLFVGAIWRLPALLRRRPRRASG